MRGVCFWFHGYWGLTDYSDTVFSNVHTINCA